jgi:hypothetical protein
MIDSASVAIAGESDREIPLPYRRYNLPIAGDRRIGRPRPRNPTLTHQTKAQGDGHKESGRGIPRALAPTPARSLAQRQQYEPQN